MSSSETLKLTKKCDKIYKCKSRFPDLDDYGEKYLSFKLIDQRLQCGGISKWNNFRVRFVSKKHLKMILWSSYNQLMIIVE